MLTNKTDLVEYLILNGNDYFYLTEYEKRLNEDIKYNLISTKSIRLIKLNKIFDIKK